MNGRSGREWPYLSQYVICVDFKGLRYYNNHIVLFSNLAKGYALRMEQPRRNSETLVLMASHFNIGIYMC